MSNSTSSSKKSSESLESQSQTEYIPKINDYVIWTRSTGFIDQGWVYFVDENYFTIEVGVKQKPHCEYSKNTLHCNEHTLVVCHDIYWNQVQYIRSRKSIYEDQ